jgi:RNA polymerase sigma factor (sigma-70 family)
MGFNGRLASKKRCPVSLLELGGNIYAFNMTDNELLREYSKSGSDAAFAELVRRHTDWIHSTATRIVHDPNLADDVTQAVFIVLARKAGKLIRSSSINTWLFKVIRYSALHALRDEARRRRREHRIAEQMATSEISNVESAQNWDEIVLRLDAATARLSKPDQQAILLRFYERSTMAELGNKLGISEDAAKKRVTRAVDRLRALLLAQGLAPSGETLSALMFANFTHPAPPSVITSAVQCATKSSAITRPSIIAKGVIRKMFFSKINHVALTIGAPLCLAVVIVVMAMAQSVPPARSQAAQPPASAPASQPSDSPYVQAIRLAKQIKGPDANLLDSDSPLNSATAAFLDRNSKILELLHTGATQHSTDWGAGTGNDVQLLLDQLSGVRAIAELASLRARLRWSQNDFAHGQDDLLDAMVFERSITHDFSMLIVKQVQIGVEAALITHWAKLLPTAPVSQIAQLPNRLKQLPPAGSLADAIRAEQHYAAQQTNLPPAIVAGMAPFYDSLAKFADQNPNPTMAQLQKAIADALAKIDAQTNPGSRSMAGILVAPFVSGYADFQAERAYDEMFLVGISVIRDGVNAVRATSDPFGQGPFELIPGMNPTSPTRQFQIRSKLLHRGKPLTLDFGV